MRPAIVTLAIGLAAAIGWLLMAASGAQVMPSYLAGWLLVFGIPAGALLLVLVQEALGQTGWPGLLMLRRVTLLLPIVSLFAIPVLLRIGSLYQHGTALAAGWGGSGFFGLRMVAILFVLSAFALVFSRVSTRPRRALAVIGCILHVSLLSVAAVDWVLGLQPHLNSSAIGLLLIASEVGTAGCLVAFLAAVSSERSTSQQSFALVLTAILSGWGFLHFIQYLVIWSADLPEEVVWYQNRIEGAGIPAVAFAAVALGLALAILPSGLARAPAVVASVSAMLLVAHWVEALWLVTPAFRGYFAVTLPDALATVGFSALAIGFVLVLLPQTPQAAHSG